VKEFYIFHCTIYKEKGKQLNNTENAIVHY
jgi:hypothetical protein